MAPSAPSPGATPARPGAWVRALRAAAAGVEPEAADLAAMPPGAASGVVAALRKHDAATAALISPAASPPPHATDATAAHADQRREGGTQSARGTQSRSGTQESQDRQEGQEGEERLPAATAIPERRTPEPRRSVRSRTPQRPRTRAELIRAVAREARAVADRPPPGRGDLPFKLARRLKSWPEVASMTGMQIVRLLREASPRWWTRYADQREGLDDVEMAMAYAWDRVKVPEGEDRVSLAARRAACEPLAIVGLHEGLQALDRFVTLVHYLAATDPVVFVPVRRVAVELGLGPMTISRCRARLSELGVLTVVESHRRGHATTYRVDRERLAAVTRPVEVTAGAQRDARGRKRHVRAGARENESIAKASKPNDVESSDTPRSDAG